MKKFPTKFARYYVSEDGVVHREDDNGNVIELLFFYLFPKLLAGNIFAKKIQTLAHFTPEILLWHPSTITPGWLPPK